MNKSNRSTGCPLRSVTFFLIFFELNFQPKWDLRPGIMFYSASATICAIYRLQSSRKALATIKNKNFSENRVFNFSTILGDIQHQFGHSLFHDFLPNLGQLTVMNSSKMAEILWKSSMSIRKHFYKVSAIFNNFNTVNLL